MKIFITLICLLSIAFSYGQQPRSAPSTTIYESLKLNSNATKKFIKVSYQEPLDSNYTVWYQVFKEDQVMEKVADAIEGVFLLNKQLKLTCMECGEANAFYNPEKKELIVCYDLFVDMMNKMSKYHSDPDSLGTKIGKAFTFVLYHEIGHAIIDLLNIPITGKEEDAADYFAFYMLGSNDIPEGVDACIEGANFFKDLHDEMKQDTTFQRINKEGNIVDALPYWDEHSFSLQRYFSINSLLYGSNPEKYSYLYYDGKIGYRRRINAIQEYTKIKNGWNKVLKNYFK